MFSREEDGTSAVRSPERLGAFRAVIRRVLLLAGFLLAGFVITACWSATASAAETGGVDETPQPVHGKLAFAVAKNVTAVVRDMVESVAAEAGSPGTVHELVDVTPVVRQVDEFPALSHTVTSVMDVVSVNAVDDVANVADVVHDASGVLVTVIDTATDGGVTHEVSSVSLLQARPGDTVVERGRLPAEAEPAAVVVGSHGGDAVVSTVLSGFGYASANDSVPASHVSGDLPRQDRDGAPSAPFSAAGSGGGTSTAGSSGGSSAGAVVPGSTRHDDVFVLSDIPAGGVYPVRQFAFVPQVSPA